MLTSALRLAHQPPPKARSKSKAFHLMTLLLQVDSNELDKHAYDDFSNLVPEYAIILVAESG
jgi:hypothetical protein